MARLAAVLTSLLLLACSSSARIADGASEAARAADTAGSAAASIKSEASAIAERSEWIAAEAAHGANDRTGIVERASQNASAAHSIQSKAESVASSASRVRLAADSIHKNLTGVEDTTPWWAGTVAWVAAAVIVVAILFILWRSGALAFLGGFFAVVTPRKRQDANLLAKVLDSGSEEGVREYAAARRASDPAFDKAIVQEKAKLAPAPAKEIKA